jgi:hypothetical protein
MTMSAIVAPTKRPTASASPQSLERTAEPLRPAPERPIDGAPLGRTRIPAPERSTAVGRPRAPNASSIVFSKEVLGEKLWAVHATSHLPVKAELEGEARSVLLAGERVKVEPSFAPTTHFALGHLVQPYAEVSWDARPYAVIVQLGQLEDQLVNVMPHDTSVLGDLVLPRNAMVLMPVDDPRADPPGVEVVRYDPKRTSLRESVSQAISAKAGWVLRPTGEGRSGDPVYLEHGGEKINVNRRRFFAPYLKSGEITFEQHVSTVDGTLHYLIRNTLGLKHRSVRPIWNVGPSSDGNLTKLKVRRSMIEFNLRRLDAWVSTKRTPPWIQTSYARVRQEAMSWVNILDAEIRLRERFGRTFVFQPVSAAVRERRYALRREPEKLWSYLMSIRDELPAFAETPLFREGRRCDSFLVQMDIIEHFLGLDAFGRAEMGYPASYRWYGQNGRTGAKSVVDEFVAFMRDEMKELTAKSRKELKRELEELVASP